MASPATAHRGYDPPPHGSARPHRADMVPILGTPSRVSEVLQGKKGLSMAMVQRLRARSMFGRPAPAATEEARASRSAKRVAA